MTIYFDNAATTRISPIALESAVNMLSNKYGNPSSMHSAGLDAERKVTEATQALAGLLGCKAGELVFTSGGTEANNLGILGAARAYGRRGRHIVTTEAEHPSVLSTHKALGEEGFEVDLLKTDSEGYVNVEQLQKTIREDTILASFIHVNNETGTVLNRGSDLAAAVKKINSNTIVHFDGVQAFCKEDIRLSNIDLYSISAHKIHGMKGAGALYIREGTRLKPLFHGGGQQRNIRPGTENTAGIVSMAAAAIEQAALRPTKLQTVANIKKILLGTKESVEKAYVNGDETNGSVFILNMSYIGVRAEVLVNALSGIGIYISAGAACSGRQKSHSSLKALRLGKDRADSAVRFSFSYDNTEEEALLCKEAVERLVNEIRFTR